MLLIRPRLLQPSSTTILYDFYICGEKSCMFETVHSSVESTSESLRAIELLRKGAVIVSLSDGSFIVRDAGENPDASVYYSSIEVVYTRYRSYLVILDPLWGCGIRCPWCYASPRPPSPDAIDADTMNKLLSSVRMVARAAVSAAGDAEFVTLSIVVGGSSEPSVDIEATRTILEEARQAAQRVAESALKYGRHDLWRFEVYTAVTLGWPHAAKRLLSVANEVVVTLYDEDMLKLHPVARIIGVDNYLELAFEAVKNGATLAVIVTESTGPEAVAWYAKTSGAEKIILLHYHPANPRLPFRPPTRNKILDVLEALVDHAGIPLNRISVDACTAIKIGARYPVIREIETRYMYRCTPYSCKTAASPCPRGGTYCVAATTP